MVMEIKRGNFDFGNSTNNFMVDGYYFEMPTNVVEISQKQASEMFVSAIDEPKDLLDRLVISTKYEDAERYYLVGEFADKSKLSNLHVNAMHDKIKSVIPYASFLGAVAYYANLKGEPGTKDSNEIKIDNINMMLPIWLLKREEKFSIAETQMAKRFMGEHEVKIITLGMEKTFKIIGENSKCRRECEVSRHALKYKMISDDKNVIKIEKREEVINKFKDYEVVLNDIGGGSTDSVLLGKGLTAPKSKDSFKVIDVDPFLGRLETLRKEKLLQYFHDLGSLEKFIIKNYKEQKYIFKDENVGEQTDFTEVITEMLQDYADMLITQILNTFKVKDKLLKFVYFGGEAPVLEPYIKISLRKHMSEQAAENNHFFLEELLEEDKKEIFKPTSRTINLAALEILSLNAMSNNK